MDTVTVGLCVFLLGKELVHCNKGSCVFSASLAAAALIPNILLREGDQVRWPLRVRQVCFRPREGGVTSLTPSSTPPPLPLWLPL